MSGIATHVYKENEMGDIRVPEPVFLQDLNDVRARSEQPIVNRPRRGEEGASADVRGLETVKGDDVTVVCVEGLSRV